MSSFSHRSKDTWNRLTRDIVKAGSVHNMKEKLEKVNIPLTSDPVMFMLCAACGDDLAWQCAV